MVCPKISVIIPCRNEKKFIEPCLKSILASKPVPGGSEIIVVDGMSEDGTREILKKFKKLYPSIIVLNNIKQIVPTAMNIGIKHAKGKYVIRLDAHAVYSENYLQLCIETIQRTKADNVGGVVVTLQNGFSFQAKCVQAITTHRFGVGNSDFRLNSKEKYVDTVPYGCFKKNVFNKIGYFNEKLVRNQDYEFNQRILKAGGKIYLNPNIKIFYYNKPTIQSLLGQAFFTAQWLSYMWYLAPYSFKMRHCIPALFTISLIIIFLLLLFHQVFFIFLMVIIPYSILDTYASYVQSKKYGWKLFIPLILFFPVYHFSYGLGTIWGLIKIVFRAPFVKKEKND